MLFKVGFKQSSNIMLFSSAMAPVLCSKASEDIQYGVESHPMKISLQLRGYPPPQVSWYHEGKLLELGDRYDTYVTPGGMLTVTIF